MLNVSSALDPRFMQPVIRVQRKEVINEYGEVGVQSSRSTIMAVVTSPAQPGLMRTFPDMQTYGDVIQVATFGPLNSATITGQPDQIIYKGQTFVVSITNDYLAFGYMRALCKLVDLQETALRG